MLLRRPSKVGQVWEVYTKGKHFANPGEYMYNSVGGEDQRVQYNIAKLGFRRERVQRKEIGGGLLAVNLQDTQKMMHSGGWEGAECRPKKA